MGSALENSHFETTILSLSFYKHFDAEKKGMIVAYIKLKISDHEKFKALICKESPDMISGNI